MAGHPQVSLPFLPHPVDLRMLGATCVLNLYIFHLVLNESNLLCLEANIFLFYFSCSNNSGMTDSSEGPISSPLLGDPNSDNSTSALNDGGPMTG
jgi:hypothetical protein